MTPNTRVVYGGFSGTKARYYVGEKEVSKAQYDKATKSKVADLLQGHAPGGQHSAGWPLYSDAVGVHPDQIPEAMAEARKHGVPTDFTPDGKVVFTSPGHRRDYCKLYGYFDLNGGYSDPSPRGIRYG